MDPNNYGKTTRAERGQEKNLARYLTKVLDYLDQIYSHNPIIKLNFDFIASRYGRNHNLKPEVVDQVKNEVYTTYHFARYLSRALDILSLDDNLTGLGIKDCLEQIALEDVENDGIPKSSVKPALNLAYKLSERRTLDNMLDLIRKGDLSLVPEAKGLIPPRLLNQAVEEGLTPRYEFILLLF